MVLRHTTVVVDEEGIDPAPTAEGNSGKAYWDKNQIHQDSHLCGTPYWERVTRICKFPYEYGFLSPSPSMVALTGGRGRERCV
jgi:hypothetical protein